MSVIEQKLFEKNLPVINDLLEIRMDAVKVMQEYNELIDIKLSKLEFSKQKSIRMVPESDPSVVVAFIRKQGYIDMQVYENTDNKPPGVLTIEDLVQQL